MADKETKSDAAADGGKKKRNKGGGVILFMIMFGLSFWFIFPTLVLFLVGLSPTFIAFLIDNDRQKFATVAVASMNAAGITPFMIDLWTKGQTMETVFQILREPLNWLVIAGAAGIGQLIVFAVPQAVASLKLAHAESRLKILKANLESLKDIWGPDVGTTKPIDRGGKQ